MRAGGVLVAIAVSACGQPRPLAPIAIAAAPTVFAPAWEPTPARVAAPAEPVDASAPPFLPGQELVGKYTCAQGLTDVRLRIVSVDGPVIAATFEFEHVPTKVAGSYEVSGSWDPDSRRIAFTAGPWLIRPNGYDPVGMDGRVSRDASSYTGRITHPGCGPFSVRAVR